MSIYVYTLATIGIGVLVYIWFKLMKKYGGYDR